MTIFKSRQVNLDPEPWRDERTGDRSPVFIQSLGSALWVYDPRPEFEPTRDPEPWARDDGWRTSGGFHLEGRGYGWAPRREKFDTPVNRVLVFFREYYGERMLPLHRAAAATLSSLEDIAGGYTPAEIAHARRVLERLANWKEKHD